MNHHIIYRQKTTIIVAKESESNAVQKEISDTINNDLPFLLQEIFDAIAPNRDILRIDSLHLHLGVLPSGNAGTVFKERVTQKIREAVIVKKEKAATESGVSLVCKEESLREAFLYFLRHGIKPWFVSVKSREQWEGEMQQAFESSDWEKIVLWLRENYAQHPVIVDRLAFQFSDDFLESIFTNAVPFNGENWKDIYRDLLSLSALKNKAADASVRSPLLSLCLSSFLGKDSLSNALYDVVKGILKNNQEEETVVDTDQFDGTFSSGILPQVINKFKPKANLFLQQNHEPWSPGNNSKTHREQSVGNDGGDAKIFCRQSGITQDKSVVINSKPSGTSDKLSLSLSETEPQYISNSGIVLLHPFLEMCYSEFDLLHKGNFRTDDACKRAVLLLHYLATGETAVEEWNLLLQKIMCGLPLDETLPNALEITDKEKEESEWLLQSVIKYCPPLKNTSVAGLQNTFLQRDGRIEKKENGWLLTVEQKTVDILLDKIPWGFSAIRLPWLNEMINVDWC